LTCYQIHRRLCEIKQKDPTKHLFGCVAIVCVGDLLQLKPVKARWIFKSPVNEQFKNFRKVENLWKKITENPIVLEHNHRQGEGCEWTKSLNRFRNGTFTKDDIKILEGRLSSDKFETPEAEHVAFTNKEVTSHNEKMMSMLPTKEYSFAATKPPLKGFKPWINPKTGNICHTPYKDVLILKVGARVSLVYNVNTSDDLVNGASGFVVGFEPNDKVISILVKFDEDKTGQEQRKMYHNHSMKYGEENGTPIRKQRMEYFPNNKAEGLEQQ
jgi:hypothetical protein